MTRRDDALRLLTMAEKDLQALSNMLETDRFSIEIFGFHAQQAIEKVLKAWLSLLGQDYPFTHDIRLLLRGLRGEGIDIEPYLDLLAFNLFAVQFRYETFPEMETTLLPRPQVVMTITQLFTTVRQHLENS